jgi:hypothetical protein
MKKTETQRIERYLQKLFRMPTIEVRNRTNEDSSAEVYIEDEFIGVIYCDDDDDDLSYQFQMAILDFDLG